MYISANELKTGGVKLLNDLIQGDADELVCVQERGKPKYIVMTVEHYGFLRACELEIAIQEATQGKGN